MEKEAEKTQKEIEICTDKLQRLFMWYCTISDNSNTNKMRLSKFLIFLKDAQLLAGQEKEGKFNLINVFDRTSNFYCRGTIDCCQSCRIFER